MSLTLPAVYSAASKLGNIKENWFVQLGFFNGDAQGSGDGGWDATLKADGTANLLNEALDDSETPVDVDDGTVFVVGDFIKVESEIMKILSISSNTVTVERGAMSTTAATHNNNTAIYWNNFTPISLADTTVDSVFYHGVITNTPSVRSSVNLSNSIAKTGNISLSVVNFQYKGDDFSAELFLGTRKYINRNVKIYSQLNGDSTLANCLQVYQGRLIDISHDDASIKLTITEQRPWDFITIPQTKTSTSKRYFPVAYGNFDSTTASTISSTDFCTNKSLFPVPVDRYGSGSCISLHPHSSSVDDAKVFYYEKNIDKFIPIYDTSYFLDTVSYEGGYASKLKSRLLRAVKFRPEIIDTGNEWTDADNSFDGSTSSSDYATDTSGEITVVIGGTEDTTVTKDLIVSIPQLDGKCNTFKQRINGEITLALSGNFLGGSTYLNLKDQTYSRNANVFSQSGSAGTVSQAYSSVIDAYTESGDLPDEIKFQLETRVVAQVGTCTATGTGKVWDVECQSEMQVDPAIDKKSMKLDHLYSGADGFSNSFTGGSDTADTGLEAHRDLLFRFSGFDAAAGDIYNYDAELDIEAARITAAWNIRWWALEPVELKKVLEQIQYEFGFIFKFRHDGTGSYWFIKNSYSSGDEAQTLKKDDIANLKINNTPFSQLLTDMRISYEKHPADNRYLSTQTSKDTTNNPRTVWNVQSKENIKEVKLDMNVNKPGNTNPGGGDPNDGFADYYMNIFGDIKKIISCDIVNPAVSYDLETGDIIQFSNTAGEMPVEPFGDNWADYYMITDLQRSPGKIRIQAREVG